MRASVRYIRPELAVRMHTTQRHTYAERENQRMSMKIDLEVLSSFVFIKTTDTSDSDLVSVWERTERGRIRESA